MDDTLRTCHPAVSFAYFALVIACAMLLMHPVCLVLSTLGGGWYVARLLGGKGLRRHLLWLLPMALLAAALNPAFVHQGVTILAYLPSGNPLTLESLLYGLAAGAMLSAVALWFVCVTDVITSDKVVYLFGRVIPALSLLLSMILRFVPRFVRRLRAVAQAQRHLGRDTQTGAPVQRVRSALRVFSIVVTWSLESGLITADSMRCRGYGLPGRTSFSLYRFDRRDGAVALWLAFCGLYLLGGGLAGGLRFQYYPMLLSGPVTPLTVSFSPLRPALLYAGAAGRPVPAPLSRPERRDSPCLNCCVWSILVLPIPSSPAPRWRMCPLRSVRASSGSSAAPPAAARPRFSAS